MNATLSYSEVIKDKKTAESAIAKILFELQELTGCQVKGISFVKIIGKAETMFITQIDINI
jgi:hypothetical protein